MTTSISRIIRQEATALTGPNQHPTTRDIATRVSQYALNHLSTTEFEDWLVQLIAWRVPTEVSRMSSMAGLRKSGGGSTRSVKLEERRKLAESRLTEPVNVPGVGIKLRGELTVEDCFAIAANHQIQARKNADECKRWNAIADTMIRLRAKTYAELPEEEQK